VEGSSAQADLYKSLVLESAEAGMFSLPLTYDSYLVIINAADIEGFKEVVSKLSHRVPVALMAYVGLGRFLSRGHEEVEVPQARLTVIRWRRSSRIPLQFTST
jgi:hypothetical protein